MSSSLDISVIPQSYSDDIIKGPYDKPTRNIECSLRLLFRASSSKWHLKITFTGTLNSHEIKSSKLHRKIDFEEFCRAVNIESLTLLNNTVTEVILSNLQSELCDVATNTVNNLGNESRNMYASVARQVHIIALREDPTRMRFLPCNDCHVPMRELNTVRKERELTAGVYLTYIHGDSKPCIYKSLDKPFYVPEETTVLTHELQNLVTLQNIQGIVRLIAVVTSLNPYQTIEPAQGNIVGRGLLLEYHSNGTLQDALQSSKPHPWKEWALQIASSLDQMHEHGLTHMDIKPSNIVISEESKAILIDVSGQAFDHAWLSPEMRPLESPPSQPFFPRVLNDTWAFGKIALQMANVSHDEAERELLSALHSGCTAAGPQRFALSEVIALLENPSSQSQQHRTHRFGGILRWFSKKLGSLKVGGKPGPSRSA